MKGYTEILNYWFDDINERPEKISERNKFWWARDNETDKYIIKHFLEPHQKAINHELDHWLDTPQGRLALIILIDQFSRNLYRDDAKAFAQDDAALQLALEGIDNNEDRFLNPFERAFFYMPLEHSENITLQNRCVALFQAMHNEVSTELKSHVKGFLNFAIAHRDIIEKFGRFPHRNQLVGRKNTPEETAFLKTPGSSF